MLCCCVAMLCEVYVSAQQATVRQKMFRQRKLKFRGGRECEPRDAAPASSERRRRVSVKLELWCSVKREGNESRIIAAQCM